MEIRAEANMGKFADENTCMGCGESYDYEMIQATPDPSSPIMCAECLGFDPFDLITIDKDPEVNDTEEGQT